MDGSSRMVSCRPVRLTSAIAPLAPHRLTSDDVAGQPQQQRQGLQANQHTARPVWAGIVAVYAHMYCAYEHTSLSHGLLTSRLLRPRRRTACSAAHKLRANQYTARQAWAGIVAVYAHMYCTDIRACPMVYLPARHGQQSTSRHMVACRICILRGAELLTEMTSPSM
jgi:hypothetical protein